MRACCAIFVFLGCSLKAGSAETAAIAATAPDPAQLIAESGALQKRPEPEMTESEQVVYDKVAPIMARRPPFALKLLKGMSKSSDPDAKPSPAFEFMLGNAYHASARYAEAEACYQRCLAQSPSFIRAWSNLGVLYYVQNRYQDAVPCFSKAVTLGDRDPATFGMLGNVLEKTGNSVSAEMAYMQALAANPAEANWSEGLLRLYIDRPPKPRRWCSPCSRIIRKIRVTGRLTRTSCSPPVVSTKRSPTWNA
jgi:tetratricopeptide (TPR) repeat protein